MRLVTSFALCSLVAISVVPSAAQAQSTALPVKRVVLYKHGIGYFERQGMVNGSATAELRFKESEMSDVLKTLTALDLGGGSIDAIAYDSQKPASKVLEEFAFALSAKDTQLALMQQLRGARIVATVSGLGEVRGAILGIDEHQQAVGEARVDAHRLSVFTDQGGIVGFDLFDAQSLRFEDEVLAADVQRYLATLRSTHKRDTRVVSIVANGTGERPLFVAYAVEQPVWKATYRIVLDEAKEPLLQGWAVVDNTSDEDWTDVQLSLIAGLPISFRQDLYTPRYAERPVFEVNERAVAFDAEELAQNGYTGAVPGSPVPGGRKYKARRAAPEAAVAADAKYRDASDARAEVATEAATREIGDLLEYRIDHAVTIPRNRSALLPIVAQRVKGERVALYSEAMRATNPMSAVRFVNATGLSLEGGPVMVLDAETYAGESQMPSVKPDETRYVPYAVDLGVKATTQYDSGTESVHSVTFKNGVMISRQRQIDTKTYAFDNKDDAVRVVVVEHAKRDDYALRQPANATETELGLYRFRVEVAAKSTQKLAVVESREIQSSIQIRDLDGPQIAYFLERSVLNAEAQSKLAEIQELRARASRSQAALAKAEASLRDIDQNQDRIRRNLGALGQTDAEKDLRKAYVDELATSEATIKELRRTIDELRATLMAEQAAVERAIDALALEYTLGR
ncbi:MAG: hypothetical protein IPH13_17430 [Planctomycetes bacterium]|nr:hypothetical protein [Planctomycetota bacterium]MCC7170074.1 hypothetical protein [Planctomycetota bacterium]